MNDPTSKMSVRELQRYRRILASAQANATGRPSYAYTSQPFGERMRQAGERFADLPPEEQVREKREQHERNTAALKTLAKRPPFPTGTNGKGPEAGESKTSKPKIVGGGLMAEPLKWEVHQNKFRPPDIAAFHD